MRYAVKVLNYTTAALDPGPLKRLSVDECVVCAQVRQRVLQVAEHGGEIRGGAWQIAEVSPLSGSSDDLRQVNAVVLFGPQHVDEGIDGKTRRFKGGTAVFTFDLKNTNGDWQLLTIRGDSS